MAVRGDDSLKIMTRAGHADFETTKIYLREAENLAHGFGDVFPRSRPKWWSESESQRCETQDANVAELLANVVDLTGIELLNATICT